MNRGSNKDVIVNGNKEELVYVKLKKIQKLLRSFYYPIKYFKKPELSPFPKEVSIEISSICNASCIWCVHNKKGLKRTPFMDFKLFKKIIDECKDKNVERIIPSFYGEPLLKKNYFKYLRYIRKVVPEVNIRLITNASLLNEKITKRLIDEKLIDEINFSLDGFSKKTFKDLKNLNYHDCLRNVMFFFKYRNLKGSEIKAGVSFVICNENLKELSEFRNFWKGKADYVDSTFDDGRFTEKHLSKTPNIIPCCSLFKCITVISNGKVPLCCLDYSGKYSMGDLNKNSIQEIWNGKLFEEIRNLHLNYKRREHLLCKGCEAPLT